MKQIKIKVDNKEWIAKLYNTPTALEIYKSLPLQGTAQKWGNEIYFYIDSEIELEPEARDVLEIGELAYWPSGPAFCIFWGATPASEANEPRAYSAVNAFGKILGDISHLNNISHGADIWITTL